LEQVTDVLVHEDGYMDDVPWHFLAHSQARIPTQSQCRSDRHRHYLKLTRDKADSSKLWLSCGKCKAKTRFNPFELKRTIKFMRSQPWLNDLSSLKTRLKS